MTTQINSTNELQAINTMLSFIGDSPVSSITGNIGTDVAVAKNILDETSMSVQSQGWFFNRELDITASRDTSNKVPCLLMSYSISVAKSINLTVPTALG